ncbi:phosphotransferase family protein [Planococcus salinarum]|uniref:phosphotransferase family protein n=1 Tax=Planococcus salinarum TaxID=622695 RepID=UPI000E3C1C38|nr:aminoglycoside phosphotransferase family protein [Planococcus salinarum]TAA66325.1 aminoglycoside phosphotransferase family protein [Planococcus salinarum]
MSYPIKNRLTAECIEWIEKISGNRVDVEEIKKLPGGTSSLVFEVPFENKEMHESIVLRLFHQKEWLAKEPDLARHEGESLQNAALLEIPSPAFIALDETGEKSGMPAVLMTKLPGTTILQPSDMPSWLDKMAAALAGIHRQKAENFKYEYFSYNDALKLEKPLWSKFPDDWLRAFFIVAGVRPPTEYSLIHRDYHPANVLWQNGELTGVVDWVNACRGPAGVDVGHCRVNLAQLFGVSTADQFLDAYINHAGEEFRYDPYWDLLSLTDTLNGLPRVYAGWTELGLTGLSDELIRHRLDEYLLSLLERFDN